MVETSIVWPCVGAVAARSVNAEPLLGRALHPGYPADLKKPLWEPRPASRPGDDRLWPHGPVGPMLPEAVQGEPEVRELLANVSAGFQEIVAERILVDGEYSCAPFEFQVTDDSVPVITGVDCFRVVEGQIVEIQPFYDPRPLLAEQ